MLTTNELIVSLENDIESLKKASMMSKPKKAEECVSSALICIKRINETQTQLVKGLVDLNARLNEHVKTGK